MTKPQLNTSTALTPPIGLVVTADDGGVGKTHTAIQLVTAFRLAGLSLDLFQLDTKKTLAEKSGETVTSLIVPDHHGMNIDDATGTDIIVPWYRVATEATSTGRSCLLEVGGALAPLFHSGITDLDLQEDIELLDLRFIAVVVSKAGGDSASQLVREVRRWERNVPGAQIVVVLNEMMGSPVAAAEHLDATLRAQVRKIFETYPTVRIPRLNPRSMALYERLPVLPSEIVSWHSGNYSEAIARIHSILECVSDRVDGMRRRRQQLMFAKMLHQRVRQRCLVVVVLRKSLRAGLHRCQRYAQQGQLSHRCAGLDLPRIVALAPRTDNDVGNVVVQHNMAGQ